MTFSIASGNAKNNFRKTRRPGAFSMCPRLQKCFWILLLIWAIYLLGVIATAVQIHKLDPTTATENTSLETKKEVSVHAAIQNTRQISPEELMKQKQEELEREKERTIHKEGEVNSKELAKTLRKETADKKDEVEKDKKKDKDTGRKAKEEKKPEEAERPKPKMKRPGWRPSPYGHMVDPVALLKEQTKDADDSSNKRMVPSSDQMLTAYLETIDQSTWDELPLPVRTTTADNLTKRVYPKLSTCSKLPEQWPVDEYPDEDPFLPWIHDVFPTDDGKFIQFVAQNKQRCHTGTTDSEEALLKHTAPQVALMQHVPLKKLDNGRYRLASHEDADPESINTRFLCKFKPSGDITFSRYNNDYEWVAYRKGLRVMFNKDGRNNGQIQTSQVLFQCPVPDHLVETVRRGSSVVDDWATIFVDLIPVRTPPRYGNPQQFLVPEYRKAVEDRITKDDLFDPNEAWGTDHILPELEDSGRWVNIPVCKPSLMTYEPEVLEPKEQAEGEIDSNDGHGINHHLVSCLWASTGYTTRGNRYAINDGQRRMLEWITFNKMLGFDHFYIYDNSGAFTNETSLQPFVDTFPGEVTVIKWPSRVCNNNPNNVDSPGERSSQYAAEASCRLRFGQHATWIGQFDIDEYLVPMGNYTSLLQLLDKLDEEGNKIISFASWRAWPRHTHIDDPVTITNKELCSSKKDCFELSVKKNTTMLEAYNCDRQKPGQKSHVMPAEKQIFRSDYVMQHFIHYSTITETTNLPYDEYKKQFGNKRPFPDPKSRFIDEVNEGLMLHSKAIARQDTSGWKDACHVDRLSFDTCRIGYPWPDGAEESGEKANADGWEYNCYVNKKIDNYWAPELQAELEGRGFM